MKYTRSLIALILVFAIGFIAGQQHLPTVTEETLDLSMANSVWGLIQDQYLWADDIDERELKYGLAKGLVGSLHDQHSAFMDPQEAENFLLSLNGDLEGIGATLRLDEGMVRVVSPLPDSPAEKAGIRAGDYILKVDGERLGEIDDLFDVVMKIRGKKGTTVTLNVLHEDGATARDIPIIRDSIHIPAVQWSEQEYLGESYAVITLASFTEEVEQEFREALYEVMDKGYENMVLDLRYNGGGYLDASVAIASYFLEGNMPVVLIRDQEGESPRVTKTIDRRFEGELVVLVNDASASASEIVAGALQDYDVAHIMGELTFGKGTVQEVHPFLDASLIRITVAEWLTPLGRSIEKNGIEPDEMVEIDNDLAEEGRDSQLEAAFEYLSER